MTMPREVAELREAIDDAIHWRVPGLTECLDELCQLAAIGVAVRENDSSAADGALARRTVKG